MHENHTPGIRLSAQALYAPVALSLLAFAANSLFCRLALRDGAIDASSFTALRLGSGALFLACLVGFGQRRRRLRGSWAGALALLAYAWLFSIAYLQLQAGVGALILFGAVQVGMFAYGVLRGEPLQRRVVAGMAIAFAGLLALLLPGADAPPLSGALLMLLSGLAWAAYSLLGKGSSDPLADTAGNFLRSVPLLAAPLLLASDALSISQEGVLYALGSGVLASGAGYSLWYGVVRQLSAQQAATLQLSVPVIAAMGAVLLLGEPLSWRLSLASLVVLGGVALALLPHGQAGEKQKP
ncbi:DMT family transporter [Pseudomonas sp. NPDC089554]|uniref:DMT family transporter n=1 Tax=Pseudomonas sp. NPDC089554 TaxID=3390653 RepID=UPI003D07BD87